MSSQCKRTGISGLFIGLVMLMTPGPTSARGDDLAVYTDTLASDDIVLIAGGGAPPAPGAGPDLSVDICAGRHAISDDIYGMNFADEALAADLRLPVRRFGGNSATRYNWQNDTSNKGSDWFFGNVPESNADPASLPDGSATDLSWSRIGAPAQKPC